MYSYDDRLRAVRLYIKLGHRVGLTIRQLGYPTKNALKSTPFKVLPAQP
jgi:putative transposase